MSLLVLILLNIIFVFLTILLATTWGSIENVLCPVLELYVLTEGNDYIATQVLNNCDLFIGRLLYINTLEFLRTSKKTVEDSLTQDPRPTFEIKGYIQSFGNGLINRVGVVVQDSTAHPSFHNKTEKSVHSTFFKVK